MRRASCSKDWEEMGLLDGGIRGRLTSVEIVEGFVDAAVAG
jgi:hypothetical protein